MPDPILRLDIKLPVEGVAVVAPPPLAVTDTNVEERAGVPGAMLRRWCRRAGLRHAREGARFVVLWDDLRAFLLARTATPALPAEDEIDAALIRAGCRRVR